jgi:hypothetical protein
MKNRFSFSFLFAFLIIFGTCQNTKTGKINPIEGKVEIVIMNGTEFEEKIIYDKKEVLRKIENSLHTTTIYLSDQFCKEIDDRNLGDSFFEMKFYEVASHKVCKAESYSEIFEPLKAQKNFGNNFLVI